MGKGVCFSFEWVRRYVVGFLVMICIFCVSAVRAEEIIFDSESVFVELGIAETLSVYGSYLFMNPTGQAVSQTIIYPFPVDSNHEFPHEISVVPDHAEKVSFKRYAKGIGFPVKIPPHDSLRCRIRYVQRIKEQKGTYILKTTQHWDRPLRYSELRLLIPQEHVFSFISYESDTVIVDAGRLNYHFSFRDFMPKKDLDFEW
ncbi:MAG: DUF4424 family protein [Chitinispirillaceae bacterium]